MLQSFRIAILCRASIVVFLLCYIALYTRKYNVRPLYAIAIVESRYSANVLFSVSYETRNIFVADCRVNFRKIRWVFGRICEIDGKKKYIDGMWE